MDPLLGQRVGEASHPGPRTPPIFCMNITVANITKLRKHKQAAISLWEEKQGILCLTETSADQHTERIVTKQVRKAGGSFLAGRSCSRSEDLRQDDSATRTFFGGVATISVPQARLCTEVLHTQAWQSTRYLEVVSRINHIQILSITLYLHPCGEDWQLYKKQANEDLLELAMQRSLAWKGPAIIAADFNMDPTKAHIWPALQMAGWVEAHSHASLLGQPTLPTFGDATKIDSMFISPCLAGTIRKIETIRSFAFPSHHPLTVEFDLGKVKSFRQIWKVPKALTPAQLQAIQEDHMNEHFVDAFAQSNQDSSVPYGASLEGWSEALETAFSNSLRLAGEKGLSRSQTGRGGPPVYRKIPINCTTKLARSGDFEPSTVYGSTKYNQIVRQVRRLISLRRQLLGRSPNPVVVHSDWRAILSAKGFGVSFLSWWGVPLPDEPVVDLIDRILDATQKLEKQLASDIAKERKISWTNALNGSWKKQGNRLAHSISSSKNTPFLQRTRRCTKLQCCLVRSVQKGRPIFRLPVACDPQAVVLFDDKPVCWHDRNTGLFRAPFDLPAGSRQITVTLQEWTMDPADIQDEFFAYWSGFWDQAPPPDSILLDPDVIPNDWRLQHQATLSFEGFMDALQRTRTDTSPGADAWRVTELRHAGEVAIRIWVQIWNHYISGSQPWPDAFTYTKIVLPGKCSDPCTIRDARPINIMALLYRVSCKAITRQVLQSLSLRLPPSIAGGLPCRSADLLWYHTQFVIEQALATDTEMFGAVTDLQKFFNSVPRFFLKRLLISFGIDAAWVTQWIELLDTMKKSVVVSQDFSLPRTSICGIPEGCPFSVAAAVMIGAHLTAWIQARSNATLLVYIDNFEIISGDLDEIHRATSLALRFLKPGPSELTVTNPGAGPLQTQPRIDRRKPLNCMLPS